MADSDTWGHRCLAMPDQSDHDTDSFLFMIDVFLHASCWVQKHTIHAIWPNKPTEVVDKVSICMFYACTTTSQFYAHIQLLLLSYMHGQTCMVNCVNPNIYTTIILPLSCKLSTHVSTRLRFPSSML